MFAQERVSSWRKNRSFATERKEAERQLIFGGAYDRSEYDGWSERIRLNDQHEVNTELVGKLLEAVEDNPYPGQRRRVLTVAVDLIPEGGKVGWRLIFEDPGFDFPSNFANEKVTFPALVNISVIEIERKLWELVRKDYTIAASDVPAALNIEPRSNAYREIKKNLESRNWRWGQRRVDGKMEKVVFPPAKEN
jgi:hypothetical protein